MRNSVRHILFKKRKVDPFLNDVVLLVKGGAEGSTQFVDSSQYNHAITRVGTSIVNSAAQAVYNGTTSIYSFSGATTNRLNVAPSPIFDIGTKNFTLEYWYNRPQAIYTWGLFELFTLDGLDFPLCIIDGDLVGDRPRLAWGTASSWYVSGFASTPTTPTFNTWHHVAFCRKNGVMRAFFDGTKTNEIADSNNIGTSGTLTLFNSSTYYTQMTGYLSHFRFTMAGRYEANFDPYNDTFMI
jgi:Concanavalin A-like lectin/glucanases superfamily